MGAEAPIRKGVRTIRPASAPGASSLSRAHAGSHDPGIIDPFISWLFRKAGLNAPAYRPKVLQRRLPACLRTLRVSSTQAAEELLHARPELVPVAVSAVLIGVTEFFRDTALFEYLETVALPELLRTRRGLRVCAAGVSDGHELYSVAMLLAQAGALKDSELVGIDCRPDAVLRAEAGVFAPKDVASVAAHWKTRYFQDHHSHWIVRPELRDPISWRVGDLLELAEGAVWDMILFRNVAIYLESTSAALIWEKLGVHLRAGGLLVVGKAEKPPDSLPLLRVAPSVYQKRQH
jgi:chemotaxis protein methyltransferase CheR